MDQQDKQIPSLYEWAGGNEALEKLTNVFYNKVLQDDLLGEVFKHMDASYPQHVAHFIGEVFGGPKQYTQQDQGSHARMVAHHVGRFLSEQQRRRWITLLLETADDVGLPSDPEFRSAFVGYLEWGSRIAVKKPQIRAISAFLIIPKIF